MRREKIEKLRRRLFTVLELSQGEDRLSALYDTCMMVVIFLSLVPLTVKETTPFLTALDRFTVSVFILDYILRWLTADLKFGERSLRSFLRYPFSFMAVVDLLTILPSLTLLNSAFKLLRLVRLGRAMRVFRVLRAFRLVRYSRSVRLINNVLHDSRESLAAVGTLALAYISISALVIFNAEPDSFDSFFEAFYWATVSLTTVGYGDIYPVSTAGRVVAMFSSMFGIAIVALPSGILTAGYIRELERNMQDRRPAEPGPEEERAPGGEPEKETQQIP